MQLQQVHSAAIAPFQAAFSDLRLPSVEPGSPVGGMVLKLATALLEPLHWEGFSYVTPPGAPVAAWDLGTHRACRCHYRLRANGTALGELLISRVRPFETQDITQLETILEQAAWPLRAALLHKGMREI